MLPSHAAELIRLNGPRFYFETDSPTGTGANLDHPLWRMAGARFCVHLDVRTLTPAEAASALIDNILAYRASFASAQAGVQPPGYGIRLAALGGWYAHEDYDGLVPTVSCNREDALPGFLTGFNFTPIPDPQHGYFGKTGVVGSGIRTTTSFPVGSGDVFGRPDDGLVMNMCKFTLASDPLLQGEVREVIGWTANTVTVDSGTPWSAVPQVGDSCLFYCETTPPACYRFTEGRSALAAWTAAFFAELDSLWPENLEHPELVSCTTENISEASISWHEGVDSFVPYIDEDLSDFLTNNLTLEQWIDEYGTDLSSQAIDADGPADIGRRSPVAQDIRSLSYGAFIIGLAWSWQLSFIDRMKQTWPKTRFLQYLLRSGTKASPIRDQPGALFYHGEPWPPDVGVSPDYYNWIFPYFFTAALRYAGSVQTGTSPTQFTAQSGSDFAALPNWSANRYDLLRFDSTSANPNIAATITAWSNPDVTCSALPVTPEAMDGFAGYEELAQFFEWNERSIGWGVWAAFRALYAHTGTLEEIYRQTCVSWVLDNVRRTTSAYPRHDVVPYISRWPEFDGPRQFTDQAMYPDPPLTTPPGYQTREDWITMLCGMIDSGVSRVVVFEPNEQSTDVLDSWVEMLSAAREFFNRRRPLYETIAPHVRNREWRKRHLWRG